MSQLAIKQCVSQKVEDSLKTLDKVIELTKMNGLDDATRALLLKHGFGSLRVILKSKERTTAFAMAKSLLEGTRKLEHSNLPSSVALELSDTLWWVARAIDENSDVSDKRCYEFFDKALDLLDLPNNAARKSRYADLTAYYSYVAKTHNDDQKEKALLQKADEVRKTVSEPAAIK